MQILNPIREWWQVSTGSQRAANLITAMCSVFYVVLTITDFTMEYLALAVTFFAITGMSVIIDSQQRYLENTRAAYRDVRDLAQFATNLLDAATEQGSIFIAYDRDADTYHVSTLPDNDNDNDDAE